MRKKVPYDDRDTPPRCRTEEERPQAAIQTEQKIKEKKGKEAGIEGKGDTGGKRVESS